MTQARRADSTKNLMAILTIIVGVILGYLVIEEGTRPAPSNQLGLNEVTGSVNIGGAIRQAARTVNAAAPAVAQSTVTTETPADLPETQPSALSEPAGPAGDVPATATVDAIVPAAEPEEAPKSAVVSADEQLEQAPPAAISPTGADEVAGAAPTQGTPDRLVLSAEDTTIVARRYVDEAPVVGPEKKGLKLAVKFASATRIVPFAFNRVGMGPEGEAAVRELVPIALKAEKVHVRGRTDSKGAFEINKKVALERAYTVREKFVEAGVPADKMGISYCTECFIATNDTEAGRRANRRVDVEFIMPADDVEALPETTYAKPLPESAQKLSFARSLGSMDRSEAD